MGNWSDWLSTFTRGVRKLLPFARSAVAEGIGRTEFYNITKRAGIGGNKSHVLRMMRDLEAAFRSPDFYVDQGDFNSRPIDEFIPPALGRQARRYSYTVSVIREDPFTGNRWLDHTTIGSSTLLDVGDIMSDALAEFDRYQLPEKPLADTMKVTSISKSESPIFSG